MRHTLLFTVILLSVLLAGCKEGKLNVASLKIEMQENPEGLSTLTPRFSWQISSNSPDLIQQSYQIQVARSEDDLKKEVNLLWDSGIVSSDESVLISYQGQPLSSGDKYFWRLNAQTNQGNSNWSKV
ncbi:MAG: alpha-rhamnosidase, partial [Petrimonas sp.]|nr:alpha-rhamnosidase [Petrimonas sp.]